MWDQPVAYCPARPPSLVNSRTIYSLQQAFRVCTLRGVISHNVGESADCCGQPTRMYHGGNGHTTDIVYMVILPNVTVRMKQHFMNYFIVDGVFY